MTELIVDSFAGGGGASLGIEMALGRSPDIAINHDAEALSMHEANHPDTLHLPHNVWKVDPFMVTRGRPIGLLWASPDCKHFSKAKGGKPVKRNIRDLAWVVVRWAHQVRPRVILLENVEEFTTWGPLTPDNQPDPERKGETFRQWIGELRRLGYHVEYKELRACDYGAPTIRKRLFLIARRDGRPIVWPEPTHGDPKSEAVKTGKRLPWRTAAEIIDWTLPCPSIFLTPEEAKTLGVKRPLADATMARIAKGVMRYVIDAKQPFIVTLNHQGAHFRGQGLGYPFKTVTSARDAHGLVVPVMEPAPRYHCAACGEDFADSHATGVGGLAPAKCPRCGEEEKIELAAPFMTYGQQGGANRSPEDPLHTVTASIKDTNAIIVPTVVGCGGRAGQSRPRGGDEPLQTATAKADSCLAAVHLTKFNTGSVGSGADEPAPTVTANSFIKRPGGCAPIGVVAATIQRQFGASVGSAADAPVGTIMPDGGGKTALAAVHLTKFSENSTGHLPDEPMHTVMAGAPRHGVVAAFLAQHNGGKCPGAREAEAPVSTVTTTGAQQAVVSAGLVNLKGSDRRASEIEAPHPTVTAQGTHSAEVRAFLVKYYGNEKDGVSPAEPLHTIPTRDRFGLVMVNGEPYEIADIGMRMLTRRELFRAQGFPDSYEIERGHDGRIMTQSASIRMCGNSVSPVMARALVAANYIPDQKYEPEPRRRKPAAEPAPTLFAAE
jgi:DNA (cytosine-5)-methyltransferase 1